MNRRCDRNQKRSERRAIYCAMHECNLYSVSQKYSLFTNCTETPQYIEASRQNTLMSVVSKTVVNDKSEWLEAFWGDECQEMTRDQVHKHHDSMSKVLVAPLDISSSGRRGERPFAPTKGFNESIINFRRCLLTENVGVIELISKCLKTSH